MSGLMVCMLGQSDNCHCEVTAVWWERNVAIIAVIDVWLTGLVLIRWVQALTLHLCGWRLYQAGFACSSTSGHSLRHWSWRTENLT